MGDVSLAEWIILGVLVLGVILLISLRVAVSGLQVRIGRLQQALEGKQERAQELDAKPGQESAFDQFLAEDPERLTLSKTDQFAAYREWRKMKGMNWSA